MPTQTFEAKRLELETYFDKTAVEGWKKLTSNEKVSGIRATVRAGRDEMRNTLLSWLPENLTNYRLLDAGCGTGALTTEAAGSGACVTAVDISENLVAHAAQKLENEALADRVHFHVGDMLDADLGTFDHVVAMDSLIHYEARDIVKALSRLAPRTKHSILFTIAPSTPALVVMHRVGKLFPRSDRSPAIQPVAEKQLRRLMAESDALADWKIENTRRVKSGFYISQAFHLIRKPGVK